MDYRLNLGGWRRVFAVPLCVAEEHIKIASGIQIKVLLYMLAHPELGLRAEIIAEAVGSCREDVDDALLYWVNAGVLSNSGTEYYPGESCPSPAPVRTVPAAAPAAADTASPLNTPEARALLNSETHYPAKAIAKAINGDNAVKCLFDMFQELAGRPPKHSEEQTLMILVEEIGLPCEVTMMLVEYCFNIERATPAYMKSVALNWVENGIDDIHKAEEYIKTLQSRYTLESALRRRFGITTKLSSKQSDMIKQWSELGISEELIDAAYDQCMDNTGKLSFPYIDKVLRNWLEKGITEPSQAEKLQKPAGQDSADGSAPSYDLDEVEQRTKNKYKDL